MVIEGGIGCADCGVSAKVERRIKYLHQTTERQVYALERVDTCTIAIGLCIAMAFLDGMAFAAFPGIVDAPGGAVRGITCVVLTFALPLALSLVVARKVNETFSQAREVHVYHCIQCGKEW